MHINMQKGLCLLTMGFALAVPAARAQGRNDASIMSSIQAMTKGAIGVAPQNFAGILGAPRGDMVDGMLAYDCSQDFKTATGGGAFDTLAIEHIEPEKDNPELWRLIFDVGVPWSRDEVPAKVQALLDPVIPQGFVYLGVTPVDSNEPDDIKFGWKGPDNVNIEVESEDDVVDGHRFVAFTISHQLPK